MKPQLFLLIAAVILAGCIGQPSSFTSTNGVIIKSVSINPPEIESRPGEKETGVNTLLSVIIQNVGEIEADLVTVKLTGLSPEWRFKPNGVGRHITCIGDFIPVGEIKKTDICRYFKVGKLFAADPSRNLNEGQEEAVYWELQPPAQKEIEQTYEVGARLNYHYKTTFDSVVKVVSSKYYQQTNKKGGISTSRSSGGPLFTSMKVASFILTDPVVEGKDLPVQLAVQNVGNGRVFLWKNEDKKEGYIIREPTEDEWDIIDVKVTLDNNDVTSQCKLTDGRHLKLINGKSAVVSCKIRISDKVETFADKAIKFELTYNYVTDSSTTVKVIPVVQ